MSDKHNLCYAQSGGVTAVINASAAGVIEAANQSGAIGRVYAAKNGVLGVLNEELIETWREDELTLARLAKTPGGAFGSCRVKLPHPDDDAALYDRVFAVFDAHKIRYFLYNGGNDSADTAMKLSLAAKTRGVNLTAVGIPKTIDNDLAITDVCPGFGSVAKYVAVSVAEVTLDLQSMSRSSTKVFVLEVMGRHAGWIAAAAGLAFDADGGAALILPPEWRFRRDHFVAALQAMVKRRGYAVVVVSEGIRDASGEFITASARADAFAHKQLGGVAKYIADIASDAGYKCHWSVADYLQRSARHIASQTDVDQARALGAAAVQLALDGKNATIPVIKRIADEPYEWTVATADLKDVANAERQLPAEFYEPEHYRITAACRRYLAPLIRGEAYPDYDDNGLPLYARPRNVLAAPKLPPYQHNA